MERIIIEDIFEVAELMYDTASDGKDTTFVGLYEDVVELIKDLAIFDDVFIERIDVEPDFLRGYEKEFYVELDTEMRLWVEKAYNLDNEVYMYNETEILFVADDCNSKILDRVDYQDAYEISYGVDECTGNCECCDCNDSHEVVTRVATDDDGKLRGFEKSWNTFEDGLHYQSTYSFFSSNEDMLKNMLNNFDIKY